MVITRHPDEDSTNSTARDNTIMAVLRKSYKQGASNIASVWHPCTQMKHHETCVPLFIAKGKGAWLYDEKNARYLDAISSWWVNLFGHANSFINSAIKKQLDTLEHVMLAGCTHEGAIELAKRLSAKTQHHLGHAFFASDGASAVEIALKMSFHFWRNSGHKEKKEFVCLQNSYHGETLGALGVTDVPLFKDAYAPLIHQAHCVPSPAIDFNTTDNEKEKHIDSCIEAVKTLFEARHQSIAAFIIEPLIQCAGNMAMYSSSYLMKLKELCKQYQVHLIADEIAVGFGRTGKFFACEHAGIWPDLMCLSKGISGGYLPLSTVLVSDAIYQQFYEDDISKAFLHSHSYTGNPLACSAALATLDLFEKEDVINQNTKKSKLLNDYLMPLKKHASVKNFRQCGTIFAFDAIIENTNKASTFSRRFFEAALKNELLIRPISHTVYLMPPYILNDNELQFLADQTLRTFEEVIKQ